MREKKDYIIITFKTTTAAMAMEKECKTKEVPGRIIPLPTQISAGCGLSWRMTCPEYDEWKDRIEQLDTVYEAVYHVHM
ncbi:MAG: DUF3343 domain-containing protein [Eubacterium sp.]|nr:DUF3343 domain-containing protein [Eubacterium sp.]